MNIEFNAKAHTYKRHNKFYTSASKIIKFYAPKFDEHGFIAAACARRDGKTKEQIQAEWKFKGEVACHWGHFVHNALEQLELTGKTQRTKFTPFGEAGIDEEKSAMVLTIQKNYKKWRKGNKGKAIPEEIYWNDEFEVCGTADLPIHTSKTTFNMFDFKTNKEINDINKYKNFFSGPLSHIGDTKVQGYTLQQSLYSLWKEQLTGMKVDKLALLWTNEKGEIIEIPVEYLKEEAIYMMMYYDKNFKHYDDCNYN